jgi:cobalt-zinc-cadmium efflux system outer membrane protein
MSPGIGRKRAAMMRYLGVKGLIIGWSALAIGCAQVPKEAGFGEVWHLFAQRVDYRLHWNQGSDADKEVDQAIEELLKDELTPDGAVQIALFNNHKLQATYEELGITQADVVEAGLLENPIFFGQARFPDRSPSKTNLEFEVAQNFLNILMLPARKKLATIQFERVKLQVADEVLKLTFEVRKAYYEAIGAKQIKQMRQHIAQATEASYETASRLHEAGNISDLDLANEQGQYEQARVVLAESEGDLMASREKLTQLMGLWGRQIAWKIPAQLPDIPHEEIVLDHLESLAVENRLDLASARKEVEALAQALGITLDWRWVGKAEVGVSSERDTDGQWVTGPGLTLELPIFDQGQADIARLEAQLRQSQKQLAAVAVDIRSEVRSLRSRLILKRNLIEHYKKVILPLRERIVDLTLKEYNYMLVGVFDLLMAKRQEFDDYQNYIEAIRDYWITRSELQRAVGGRLPLVSQNEITDSRSDAPENDNLSEVGWFKGENIKFGF